jgi:hypothetical protein
MCNIPNWTEPWHGIVRWNCNLPLCCENGDLRQIERPQVGMATKDSIADATSSCVKVRNSAR